MDNAIISSANATPPPPPTPAPPPVVLTPPAPDPGTVTPTPQFGSGGAVEGEINWVIVTIFGLTAAMVIIALISAKKKAETEHKLSVELKSDIKELKDRLNRVVAATPKKNSI